MKTVNKYSRFTGVSIEINNGKNIYWLCRVQRKNLRFKKRFPFTEHGEELAGETYKNKINELQSTG